jgi:hypothetical protein
VDDVTTELEEMSKDTKLSLDKIPPPDPAPDPNAKDPKAIDPNAVDPAPVDPAAADTGGGK